MEQKLESVFEIDAEIYYEDYKDKLKTRFLNYKKNLHLPGFRKGNIPSALVKNQKKRMLLEEADAIINERFQSYLKDNKIELLLEPIFIPMQRSDSKHDNLEFRYKVTFHAKPKIEFDLSVIKKVVHYEVEVEEVDIDNEISRIRHTNAVYRVAENFDEPDNLIFELALNTENYPRLSKSLLIEYKDIEDDDYKKLLLSNRETGALINLPLKIVLRDRFEDYNEECHEGELMPEDTIEIELKNVVEPYLPEISIEMIYNEYKFLKRKNSSDDSEIRELIRKALVFMSIENASFMNYRDVVSELKRRYKIDISREFCENWVLCNLDTLYPFDGQFRGDTEDNNEAPDPEIVKNLTDEIMNKEELYLIAQRLSEQLNYKASIDKDMYKKYFISFVGKSLQSSQDIALDSSGKLREEWLRSNSKFFDSQSRRYICYRIIAEYVKREKLCKTKTNNLD